MSVALVIQHTTHMCRIVLCGLLESRTSARYLINGTLFGRSCGK